MSVDYRALLEQAYLSLENLQQRVNASERARTEPIAIVGMACRFPGGVDGPDAYWRLVLEGADAISTRPAGRWDDRSEFQAGSAPDAEVHTRWGGFLSDVDQFDAAFFGIAPREATRMDPQQRLWLEVAWEALESAGQTMERLAGSRSGVFVGICSSDYSRMMLADAAAVDAYDASGGAYSIVANRLSYVLDLRGPSVAVDTACSSSLVAVHLAAQSLKSRECDLAVAGGVNLMLSPENSISLSRSGMLAPDGRCKTFDATANGTVRGEGCGVVVLKRLSDARAAGDGIYGVIRGSAVNQDGRSNGLTAPSVLSQEAVLREALANAGVRPDQVSYIEAHGTGTPLGDPIEVEALAAVYGQPRPSGEFCALGSVKPNIGHLEAAAGIAGLLKAVLALRHGTIPPQSRFDTLNPHISLRGTPLVIPRQVMAWTSVQPVRRAGVSSFGFGGTNAHVVLEEAPRREDEAPAREASGHVLTVSARSHEALQSLTRRYEELLTAKDAPEIHALCDWTNLRRSHHAHRLAVAGTTRAELAQRLAERRAHRLPWDERDRDARVKLAFVFSGQGAQWAGMGRALFAQEPIFQKVIDECEAALRPFTGWSLVDELEADADRSRLDRTDVAQPALFAMQLGLAAVWRAWGIEPDAVIGHSVGEVAAACHAGALSVADAARLVAVRGQTMQLTHGRGAMVAVECSEQMVGDLVARHRHGLAIAAVNGPTSTVLSGDTEAIAASIEFCTARGIRARRLSTAYAFHSAQVNPAVREFERALGDLRPATATLPIVSTLTGRSADGRDLTPDYWARQMQEPVRFQLAIDHLSDGGYRRFVEISPHPVLCGDIRDCLEASGRKGTAVASLRRSMGERRDLLGALAELYMAGHPVAWDRLASQRPRPIALPPYPWQRQRYWIEGRPAASRPTRANRREAQHPLLGIRIQSPLAADHYESAPSVDALPYLADHRLLGQTVFPLAAFLEMALATVPGEGAQITDVLIEQPLTLSDPQTADTNRVVQLILGAENDGRSFQIFSTPIDGDGKPVWSRHATGTIQPAGTPAGDDRLDRARARCVDTVSVEDYYADLRRRGLEYGRHFQGISALWTGASEALGSIRLPDMDAAGAAQYRLHPALLDACLQVVGPTLPNEAPDLVHLPVAVERLTWHKRPGRDQVWCHASLRASERATADLCIADLALFEPAGHLIAEIRGLMLKRTSRAALAESLSQSSASPRDCLYATAWTRHADVPSQAPRGSWLIVAGDEREHADSIALGRHLAALLERGGASCQVETGEVSPALLAEPWQGIVHLRGLDVPSFDVASVDDWRAYQDTVCGSVLRLVQGLARSESQRPPRLWIVTSRAQSIESDATSPLQGTVWGMARVMAREHPELRAVCVDIDVEEHAATSLVTELGIGDREDQVAWRRGGRYVARLVRHQVPTGDTRDVELGIDVRGVLDNLRLRPMTRVRPARGEVEIRVHATGLNFRDVLNALDLYPGDAKPLGGECAGLVTAVGDDVFRIAVGDSVVALSPRSFATYATCAEAFVVNKPERLSMEAAAGLPVAYLTAAYALERVARLQPGERILIHAAAGGVGLAAVRLAQRAGAAVFATAGSVVKRRYLEQLGVPHVLSSRSLDFSREVRTLTRGEGIDVVLNSLVGEAIPESLSLLRRGGRFVELGKRGAAPVTLPSKVSYHAFDLSEVCACDAEWIRRRLEHVLDDAAAGSLPTLPLQTFPLADAHAAFRYMAQARHIGKVIVTQAGSTRPQVRGDGAYVITGGLGDLGLAVARWLVAEGARCVVLIGRHLPSAVARQAIADMQAHGAQVHVKQADVASSRQVADLIADITASMPAMRGVIHAAGVLDDGPLVQQTWERFVAVLAPKVAGAWNLHAATKQLPLDFFVMFSSASAVLGWPGLGSYAAANAFLDSLADYRRTEGLPALSIQWGPWAEVGMAASRSWSDAGIDSLRPSRALEIFGRVLGTDARQVAVLPVEWSIYRDRVGHDRVTSLLADVALPGGQKPSSSPTTDGDALRRRLAHAPPSERATLLEQHVTTQAARILGLTGAATINPRQPLQELGLDSLMAVELRNRLSLNVGLPLPASLLFDYPTVQLLSAYLAAALLPAHAVTPIGADVEAQQLAKVAATLEEMSETEVESLLQSRLERL